MAEINNIIATTMLTSTSVGFNSTSFNKSNLFLICSPLSITALIITSGIVASCIMIGNGLVIIAIGWGSARFSRPMYWFIIHLSFSDFLVGLMLMWNFCLAALFNISNSLTSLLVLQSVWVTSTCSSTLGILYLAIDRYMQVVHRRLHNIYFTKCLVGWAIALAWIIPSFVFLVTPVAFGWSCQNNCRCHEGRYMECRPFTECSLLIPPFAKSHILIGLIYLYAVMPWPILLYSLIFIKARKTTQILHKRISNREIRLIQTLVVIMTVFLVTLAPTAVVMMMDYFNTTHDTQLVDYAVFMFLIAALNSLANPILYLWRIPAIRLSLRTRFHCFLGGDRVDFDRRRTRRGRRRDDVMMTSNQASPTFQHSPPITTQRVFTFQDKVLPSEDSDSSPLFTRSSQKNKEKRRKFEISNMRSKIDRLPQTPPRSPLCRETQITRDGKSFRIRPQTHRDKDLTKPPDSSSLLHSSPSPG